MLSVSSGDWIIASFRNKDIRDLLYQPNPKATPEENRRRANAVTRKFRLLRAHGLIEKQGEQAGLLHDLEKITISDPNQGTS